MFEEEDVEYGLVEVPVNDMTEGDKLVSKLGELFPDAEYPVCTCRNWNTGEWSGYWHVDVDPDYVEQAKLVLDGMRLDARIIRIEELLKNAEAI